MLAAALALGPWPANAARPLLDSGKWDQYFALFARDTQVPWKRVTVRLDTYSGAPVDFAAYEADPADVLVAGANARPRAIDTSKRQPVVRWKFTPPPGLKFESNDVEVPLANREGFFVVEARRGEASQQVWLNLSRIGLLSKEAPGGIALYAADLGSGKALAGMRLTYLVNAAFTYGKTDADGVARVPAGAARPRFALAEWGKSRAFLTFVPQSPVPSAVVGVRLERGVVRAGERVRIIGFARRRNGNAMRPAGGEVHVTIAARGRTFAGATPKLDTAGAFSSEILIPGDAPAGDVVVLASSGGATGGATLRVDGVGDATLAVSAVCGSTCAPDADVPIVVTAKRNGVPLANHDVRVRVVRTPHVLAPGTPDDAPQWATTAVADRAMRTDELGTARFSIPAPTDALASTYGIAASSGAATASTRVVTPTAKIALAVQPERSRYDIGETAVVAVRAFDALDGSPASGQTVHVHLVRGPSVQDETVKTDADGRARLTFRNLIAGTSLLTAELDVDGKRALDATALTVAPSALQGGASRRSNEVRIALDRARYHVNQRVSLEASLAGATGDAFVTLEGAKPFATQTVGVRDGKARASLTVPETVGDAYAGVAFVRDGSLHYGVQRIVVDGPGHPRQTTLSSDKPGYAPGSPAKITIADGDVHGNATLAIRLGDGRPARGAAFEDAPDILATAGTTSQNPASDDPGWHAWVAPARSTAGDLFSLERPRAGANGEVALAVAATRALVWRIDRSDKETFEIALPAERGKYVLSVLKITDDGDVGTASLLLTVQ